MTERNYRGPDSGQVREMFGHIAHRYDFLNHFLSASLDRRWRRLAVQKVQELTAAMRPRLCLDLCSGTGDLAGALYRRLRCGVIACDFSHPMLVRAVAKFRGLPLSNVEADALSLPFADATFDALTVAFGLRNLEDPVRGLQEMQRVLKGGGSLVILEFSRPRVPVLRHAFGFYFRNVLPRLGALISGHATAYQYLPESVGKFFTQQELLELLKSNGFTESGYRNLSGGIAALHWARNGR